MRIIVNFSVGQIRIQFALFTNHISDPNAW